MSDVNRNASRKSLIATSAASFVLWASNSPGINWAVDIDGPETWGFLLAAHTYFFAMYIVNQGLESFQTEFLLKGTEPLLRRSERWMDRPFVTLLAIGGYGVIGYNLIVALQSSTAKGVAHSWY